MEAAHQQPAVLRLAADKERLAALEESNKLLEDIQKVCIHPCQAWIWCKLQRPMLQHCGCPRNVEVIHVYLRVYRCM
jgi:hypothetical protein